MGMLELPLPLLEPAGKCRASAARASFEKSNWLGAGGNAGASSIETGGKRRRWLRGPRADRAAAGKQAQGAARGQHGELARLEQRAAALLSGAWGARGARGMRGRTLLRVSRVGAGVADHAGAGGP